MIVSMPWKMLKLYHKKCHKHSSWWNQRLSCKLLLKTLNTWAGMRTRSWWGTTFQMPKLLCFRLPDSYKGKKVWHSELVAQILSKVISMIFAIFIQGYFNSAFAPCKLPCWMSLADDLSTELPKLRKVSWIGRLDTWHHLMNMLTCSSKMMYKVQQNNILWYQLLKLLSLQDMVGLITPHERPTVLQAWTPVFHTMSSIGYRAQALEAPFLTFSWQCWISNVGRNGVLYTWHGHDMLWLSGLKGLGRIERECGAGRLWTYHQISWRRHGHLPWLPTISGGFCFEKRNCWDSVRAATLPICSSVVSTAALLSRCSMPSLVVLKHTLFILMPSCFHSSFLHNRTGMCKNQHEAWN